jgi:peroxiredoxin
MNINMKIGIEAPDFELLDTQGNSIKLSKFRGVKIVLLAFLRGFIWPYCRKQLGQLRDNYEKFNNRDTEVVAIGPDGPRAFKRYWTEEKIPFIGLADIGSKVGDKYQQEVNLFKFGRMPAEIIVDRKGVVQYFHYGDSMSDIPSIHDLITIVDQVNKRN